MATTADTNQHRSATSYAFPIFGIWGIWGRIWSYVVAIYYVSNRKIMINFKYLIICVHHTSPKSNDKLISVEAQILFNIRHISDKTFSFDVGRFCSLIDGITRMEQEYYRAFNL